MYENKHEIIISEDGKRITVPSPFSGTAHTFELVDHVPLGYSIWNIGENMADGYLPLCRLCSVQPFPGGRNIELDTLKAIKCEHAQIILKAIGYGPDTPEKMKKFIQRYEDSGKHRSAVSRMIAALPYLEKIKFS